MANLFKHRHKSLNKKGFSLVEVLIAIAILVIVSIPLAMNMITSAQLNGKAKEVSSSSDLSKSILEVTKSVSLSDILTDINGYKKDEYGADLDYLFTSDTLSAFDLEDKFEAIYMDGKYTPVTKQEDVQQDVLVTSSIKTRNTGEVLRAYFTGQKNDHYYFVLKNINDEESNVDIVATITPEQKFDIVNISALNQTEMLVKKLTKDADRNVAHQFQQNNGVYTVENPHLAIPQRSQDWYYKNMKREITIDVSQETFSEATNIIISAKYTVDDSSLPEGGRTISKTITTFTTNSTSEFARGIYFYYYPLLDNNGSRDHFEIINKNELAVPIYLIALTDGEISEEDLNTKYHPSILVQELSNAIYNKVARTTVCSTIADGFWTKELEPAGRTFNIKTLGNASEQQTLYKIVIQVYRHRPASYDEDGVFTPRAKDLLVQTEGTFIDTSEKLDIDSDKTTGLTPTPGIASAGRYKVIYDGTEQEGVYGVGVTWEGVTKAINAGTYKATATPSPGNTWADGSDSPKTFTWVMERSPTATAQGLSLMYNRSRQNGVVGEFVDFSGATSAVEVSTYIAYATPDSNHAWEDGTYNMRTIKWAITPAKARLEWKTGTGYDTWNYDGEEHKGECIVILPFEDPGESCYPIYENNSITNVGSVTAKVVGLTNPNYEMPTTNTSHILKVITTGSANVTPVLKVTYNGKLQKGFTQVQGVSVTGTPTATAVGRYQFVATPVSGYTWTDGTTGPKVFNWEIEPLEAVLQWGQNQWTYDGTTHMTTCIVKNLVPGDTCQVLLKDNAIKDAGEIVVTATGLTNNNYKLPSSSSTMYKLTVLRARLSTYATQNFNYDGMTHVGVSGQYIVKTGTSVHSEVNMSSNTVIPYTCTVTPMSNYAWSDGTFGSKVANWYIYPKPDASYVVSDRAYIGSRVTGVFLTNAEVVSGKISETMPGTYTAQLKPKQNHAWSNGQTNVITVSWKIEIALITTPVLKEFEFTYDGSQKAPTVETTTMSPESIFLLSGDLTATNAGTYKITATLKDPIRTTWADGTTQPIVLTWRINKKEVTFRFDSNTWTYDRTEKTGTATLTNLVQGDSCGIQYSNNKRTEAGSQNFTITGLTNPNYKLPASGLTGTMTINKRTIGINWNTIEWTYNGGEKTVSPTATNVCSGDTCTLTVIDNKRTNAGTQTVTVTGLSNANYQLPAGVTQTMTIKRSPTATVSARTGLVYNEGWQDGTIRSYVDYSSGDQSAINAGDYTAYYVPDSNHLWEDGTDSVKSVTWSIDKASGHVVAPVSISSTFDGKDQQLTYSGGTNYGSLMLKLGDDGTWSTAHPTARNQGTYTIYYYSTGDSNHYSTSVRSVTSTINPKKVSNYTYSPNRPYTATYQTLIWDLVQCTVVEGSTGGTTVQSNSATLRPNFNYSWSRPDPVYNGTQKDWVVPWNIYRSATASYTCYPTAASGANNAMRYAQVKTNHCTVTGSMSCKPPCRSSDIHTFKAICDPNYAWSDGSGYKAKLDSWSCRNVIMER